MTPDLSKIYHAYSKDHARYHPPISSNSDEWPEDWKTTYYKTYPRFEKIALSDETLDSDCFTLIKNRRSSRNFTGVPISTRELSILLKWSCGEMSTLERDRKRRAQPSGGSRFPIEIYPLVLHGDTISPGLYHYNVRDHALDVLPPTPMNIEETDSLFTYRWVKDAAAIILMTSVFWRTQNKYGERGYRYVSLEAGHIGQNLYLVAQALGLKCCALTGTRDIEIEKMLEIDGVSESLVYAIAVGK